MTVEDDKLAQFEEFFSIEHQFTINACLLTSRNAPSYDEFIANMPASFRLASEVISLDQSALKPLQTVAGIANQLMEYLNHQAKKIDLLVGYVLEQENNENERFQATKFGGGGVIFNSPEDKAFQVADLLILKLFFTDENTAIYSIAEVISVENLDEQRQHKVIFYHIREEDRELLVRQSLHQQSKQLQQRAAQRKNQQNTDQTI